jgi:predicted DNA-binding protein (MmcQ/YjbR family)
MPTAADLHARLAAFPGAVLEHPFGPIPNVYKVGRKMFAIVFDHDGVLRISLKCDPFLAEVLREAHPAVKPGYHANKRHWNTVWLDEPLPEDVLWNMIEASYELVRGALPKAKRTRSPPLP